MTDSTSKSNPNVSPNGNPDASPDASPVLDRTAAHDLNIGFVGTAHPMRGGLAQYNALLSRELAKEHDVHLVSFTRQYPSIFFPGKTQYDTSDDPVRYDAKAMVDSVGPWTWEKTARHLSSLERPLDGLIFKYWMPFFAPAFGTIARRVKSLTKGRGGAGPRVVAILDNLIPHERRPFDLALTRYFTGAVDAYVAMSASVRDDLMRHRPDASCELVLHPVYNSFGDPVPKDEARARLGIDPKERMLLFFGFVRDYKGLDVLLDAMPRISEQTGARLWVVGEFYSGKDRTVEQIQRLGLNDKVVLEDGYVPDERVGLYFSAADTIVLPYRSATQSGIVPIAYQLERPVICSDVGGLAEIVLDGETGLIVPPEDPDSLVRAVSRFYDEDLEPGFIPRIREEKRKYSWDRLADAVVRQIRGNN